MRRKPDLVGALFADGDQMHDAIDNSRVLKEEDEIHFVDTPQRNLKWVKWVKRVKRRSRRKRVKRVRRVKTSVVARMEAPRRLPVTSEASPK